MINVENWKKSFKTFKKMNRGWTNYLLIFILNIQEDTHECSTLVLLLTVNKIDHVLTPEIKVVVSSI
jgi:hypothetical protein